MMKTTLHVDSTCVQVRVMPDRAGILGRLLPQKQTDLDHLPKEERQLAFAMADLRALADELGEALDVSGDTVTLSHRLVAAVDAETGNVLGLPPLTDMTLRTDAEGVLGTERFRLRTQWMRAGQQRTPRRTGAIMETDRGRQRIPLWMLDALAVSDDFKPGADDAMHWEALARFRKALEPGVEMSRDQSAARLSMTDFLSGLEVTLADRFSISPDAAGDHFRVVPFASDRIDDPTRAPTEAMAELADGNLQEFQRKFQERGALAAYRLGPGRFMVVDRSAAPALRVMAEMQRAPMDERRAFIRNPRERISAAIEENLRRGDGFADLSPAVQEEMIDAAAGPVFVETVEFMRFSDRVTGTGIYTGNPVNTFEGSGTTWLPEIFTQAVIDRLGAMTVPDLEDVRQAVEDAVQTGAAFITLDGQSLPATAQTVDYLNGLIAAQATGPTPDSAKDEVIEEDTSAGKVILNTADNFDDVQWRPSRASRETVQPAIVPATIRTRLKDHQVDSLTWQIAAWKAGLPGCLNADEQGLGKTLQTVAFLVWLNEHMKHAPKARGPILVVAPTSLLENWEQEVTRHVASPGLGHLIRLYGEVVRLI